MSDSKGFSFSALEMFAHCQRFLQLISAAFRSMEDSEQTNLKVRELQKVVGVATNNISALSQSAVPEEAEKQLHYSASLLFPIFLAMIIAQSQNVSLSGIILDTCGDRTQECKPDTPAICRDADEFKASKIAMPLLVESVTNHELTKEVNTRLLEEGQFGCAIDCEGEVYLLPGACVFKPKHSLKPTARHRDGFESGAEWMREIAAYEIDKAYGGFAKVPTTMEATVSASVLPNPIRKTNTVGGSMQKWVESTCSSEDMGSSRFKTEDVHAIGILDLLLYNCDRHDGNMLVTNAPNCGKARLVPIDHGLCLPSFKHLGQAEFAWLYWRQAKTPFTPAESALISRLNGDRIAKILSRIGIADDAILTARIMVMVIQVTNLHNWSLNQMGELVSKHFTAKQSKLEVLVDEATAKMDGLNPTVEPKQFMAHFNAALDVHLNQQK